MCITIYSSIKTCGELLVILSDEEVVQFTSKAFSMKAGLTSKA